MKKILKSGDHTYEGIFMPLPGKQNYGHLMVGGVLLYAKNGTERGKAVEFACGRADEVIVVDEDFAGFFNLDENARVKEEAPKERKEIIKPIKLNKREEIRAMSKNADEMVIAMKNAAVDGIVYLKEVIGVNPNKLYGHLMNLEKAKIIKRLGKDKKRGTKIKMLR